MTILELPFPHVDPVAIAIGPVRIHWYAIMYLLAFAMAYGLMRLRLRHQPFASITKPSVWVPADIEDLLLYGIAGVILGGRLGYVLFYQLGYYVTHPLDVFKVWDGGMSFHGGAIGVILGMAFFAWRRSRPFLQVADFLVPSVPIGLAAGRIGNLCPWCALEAPALAAEPRDVAEHPHERENRGRNEHPVPHEPSHRPTAGGGPSWTRTSDLILIRDAL